MITTKLYHILSAVSFRCFTIFPGEYVGEGVGPTYSMTMVDTIYVNSMHRNKGLGMMMVEHAFSQYITSDIGFSSPISTSLYAGNNSKQSVLYTCIFS